MADVIKGLLPDGRAPQVLEKQIDDKIKSAVDDFDALPTGGTQGQVLVSDGQGGSSWSKAPTSLPDGGSVGQALVKQSDGSSKWATVPSTQVWDYDAQVKAQGFALVLSVEEPLDTVYITKEGESYPVIWQKPTTQLVPVVPEAPFYKDKTLEILVPNLVGVDYKVVSVEKDGSTTSKDITVPEGVTYSLAGTVSVGSTVTIQAVPSTGYKMPADFRWIHTFPDFSKFTIVTSDTFSTGTNMVGRSSDAGLGGTAQAYGQFLNGAGAINVQNQPDSMKIESGKLVIYPYKTEDWELVQLDVGSQNMSIEADIEFPDTGAYNIGFGLAAKHAKGLGSNATVYLTDYDTRLWWDGNTANSGRVQMRTGRAPSGHWRFDIVGDSVSVEIPGMTRMSFDRPTDIPRNAANIGNYFNLYTQVKTSAADFQAKISNLKVSRIG